MEACEVCGYEWDAVTAEEIPGRLRRAAEAFGVVLAGDPANFASRPDPDTWSIALYCSHTRDVMLNLRDRIVCGLAEDNPTPKAMFSDVRIDNGVYAADTADRLAIELDVAAGLLARLVEALDDARLSRPIFYPWPRPETRTLLWVASQALHEAEHHLTDVQRLAAR